MVFIGQEATKSSSKGFWSGFLTINNRFIDIFNLHQALKHRFFKVLQGFEGFGATKSCSEAFFSFLGGPTSPTRDHKPIPNGLLSPTACPACC